MLTDASVEFIALVAQPGDILLDGRVGVSKTEAALGHRVRQFGDCDAGQPDPAAEIGTNRLAKGDTSDVIIEIRDERNQRVCTVTASMKIERHNLRSQRLLIHGAHKSQSLLR